MASKLDRLAAMAREGAKSTVAEATGTNGQPKVILEHGSGALAEIYAHGATVTRYRSPGGREVLWTSSIAVFDGKKAIRGGIPVVFPFFGPNPDERVGTVAPCPQHGFARTSRWSIADLSVTSEGGCKAVFQLQDSEATRSIWPFAFKLTYEVVLDEDSLATSLTITNSGEREIAPQCLLHTYLNVADSRQVMIFGLEESEYADKLTGKTEQEDMPAIQFRGETDRIYSGASRKACPLAVRPEGVRVDAHGALLEKDGTVSAEIAADVVIWNPHVNKAKAMGDFDDDGWTAMACVEPGIVASDRTDIAPGASLVLSQTIAPED